MDTLILNRKSCTSSPECVQISPANRAANDKLLSRIANHLILNTSFLDNLGLYHGKMGIVLFFAHYAKYTGNSLYDDFAGELLDEIYEEIDDGLPIDLENGLCGIGWGIEYLLQNGFMEGDSDEILSGIDKKIMQWDIQRLNNLSIENGLQGVSIYINVRMKGHKHGGNRSIFDKGYLSNWKKCVVKNKLLIFPFSLVYLVRSNVFDIENENFNIGLRNGSSGYGLNLIIL